MLLLLLFLIPAFVPEIVPPALLVSETIAPLLLSPTTSLMILPLLITVSELLVFSIPATDTPLSNPLFVNVFAAPVATKAGVLVELSVPVLAI
ncbi:hypothetical protein [Kluyvera ascorbata]|uniref:hypothetical protein n=1 Tax=Kluyvera ascorbata TaxID=51288 RepID=UPI0018A54599|nr:hypothetical protein KATP_49170 [Kluyvera ascorbata]